MRRFWRINGDQWAVPRGAAGSHRSNGPRRGTLRFSVAYGPRLALDIDSTIDQALDLNSLLGRASREWRRSDASCARSEVEHAPLLNQNAKMLLRKWRD